jgi:hypothetical protein
MGIVAVEILINYHTVCINVCMGKSKYYLGSSQGMWIHTKLVIETEAHTHSRFFFLLGQKPYPNLLVVKNKYFDKIV